MRHRTLFVVLAAAASLVAPSAFADSDPSPSPPEPTPRRTMDMPDSAAGSCDCTHAIYFIGSDGADDSLDVNGTIASSIRSIRTWFAGQMRMAPRIDLLDGTTTEDITFVRGRQPRAAYTSLRTLTTELADRGFNEPRKRYLIYAGLDRGTTCGESTFGTDLVTSPTYATVYLDSPGCGARNLGGQLRGDALAAHEWLHADGVVSPTALHHCPTSIHHVCTAGLHLVANVTGIADPEQPDILYPYVDARLSAKVLDRGRDDYLDHGNPVSDDLRRSSYLEPA